MVGKMIVGACIMAALLASPACATVVVDFYSDGVIQDGDVYDVVNLWNDARVIMTGGQVRELFTNDFSILELCGGTIGSRLGARDFSTVRFEGSGEKSVVMGFSGSATAEISGWIKTASLSASDSSDIHLYVRDFSEEIRRPGYVKIRGLWGDGTRFTIGMRGGERDYSHFKVDVIPEPCSLGLLTFGAMLVKFWKKSRARS